MGVWLDERVALGDRDADALLLGVTVIDAEAEGVLLGDGEVVPDRLGEPEPDELPEAVRVSLGEDVPLAEVVADTEDDPDDVLDAVLVASCVPEGEGEPVEVPEAVGETEGEREPDAVDVPDEVTVPWVPEAVTDGVGLVERDSVVDLVPDSEAVALDVLEGVHDALDVAVVDWDGDGWQRVACSRSEDARSTVKCRAATIREAIQHDTVVGPAPPAICKLQSG